MSTLKLYNEEQVIEAYNKGRTDWIEEIEDYNILSHSTPIELPSDEEIKNISKGEYYDEEQRGFISGASWIKEQILNQNK